MFSLQLRDRDYPFIVSILYSCIYIIVFLITSIICAVKVNRMRKQRKNKSSARAQTKSSKASQKPSETEQTSIIIEETNDSNIELTANEQKEATKSALPPSHDVEQREENEEKKDENDEDNGAGTKPKEAPKSEEVKLENMSNCSKCGNKLSNLADIFKTNKYECINCGLVLCRKCSKNKFKHPSICSKCYRNETNPADVVKMYISSNLYPANVVQRKWKKADWQKLAYFPSKYPSNLVRISDYEYVSAPSSTGNPYTKMYSKGIYKYDVRKNEWELFIEYPTNFRTTSHLLSLNKSTEQLYLHGNEVFIAKFDIVNKQFIEKVNFFRSWGGIGYHPTCIMIEGNQYHMICGKRSKHHLIFNELKRSFETQYTFNHLTHELIDHSIIYLSKRKEILVFGGVDRQNYIESVWIFKIKDNKWKKIKNLKIIGCTQRACIVPTNDERYILIFGGRKTAEIDILDLNNMVINKSKISCPMIGTYWISKTVNIDESICITNGYIRDLWENEKHIYGKIQHLPIDIIKTIEIWYRTTYIHLVKRNTGAHWKMPLDHILRIALNR